MMRTLLLTAIFVMVAFRLSAQDALRQPSGMLDDEKHLQVLVFLSPECPICQNYSLTLNQLEKQYSGKVNFVGVVPGKAYSVDEVKEFVQKYKIRFPVYIDRDKVLSGALQAKVTPEVFLLRSRRNVYYHGSIDNWVKALGMARAKPTAFYLKDAIDQTIGGKPVAISYNSPVGCTINDY